MVEDVLGLENDRVSLTPYQSQWQNVFKQEATRLRHALGDTALDIQHIGSTSVSGLSAKPVLDIGVAVADFDEAFAAVAPVERLHYTFRGERGVPRRHYFVKGPPERRTHHLHVLEQTSEAWQNHLLFRDYLRAHPDTVRAYEALKKELARTFPYDREAYTSGKNDFISRVLRAACES